MTAKEKAEELVSKMCGNNCTEKNINRMIPPAIIAVKNEYYSLKELLFYLKSCGVITDERFYLDGIQKLIDDEQEVIKEIEQL